MSQNQKIAQTLTKIRQGRPLVQAITNYVTIADCANILIACGASPAMVEAEAEVEEFTPLASSLYLNVGTLTAEQRQAMPTAAGVATGLAIPIILDPVAVGAMNSKARFVRDLLERFPVAILKGNMGEIKSLAGFAASVQGVDSTDDGRNGLEACRQLALQYNTVVVATGAADIISDGTRSCAVHSGHPLLACITGSGCMVGAMMAAAAAVAEDPIDAALTALLIMGAAAEEACALAPDAGPGTFRALLFDRVYHMTPERLILKGDIQWL